MTASTLDLALLARFFRGLADPSRLAILTCLQRGERTSGEVAAETALAASNASRHLACLRDCGLVESRQEWRRVYYRLAPGVGDLLEHNASLAAALAERIAACPNVAMMAVVPGRREGVLD